MSFTSIIILALAGYVAFRHFARKKRAADAKNWAKNKNVDFRNDPAIRPITRRLPHKDL